MSRYLGFVTFGFLIFAPLPVLAKQSFVYEFSAGAVNVKWEGIGQIEMRKQPAGILLTTGSETGMLLTSQEPPFLAHAGILVATAAEPQDIHFVWKLNNGLTQDIYSAPLFLNGTASQNLSFILRKHEAWTGGSKQLGLALPPQSSVIIHGIELSRWNLAERLWSIVSSFWTLDEYRPYSINFIWGPKLATTPAEQTVLYDTVPPTGVSATAFVSIVIILLVITLIALGWKKPQRWNWVTRKGVIVLAILWVLFDLRMGAEFLSWVWDDHRAYISVPEATGLRTFRERDQFYDFAEFVKPLVSDRESYIFFAEQQWPYLGNMRYLTYPAIPSFALERDDTWVVYRRPDLTVNEAGQMMIEGEPITGPGEVLGRFDLNSFVYRTSAPAP